MLVASLIIVADLGLGKSFINSLSQKKKMAIIQLYDSVTINHSKMTFKTLKHISTLGHTLPHILGVSKIYTGIKVYFDK